MKMWLLLSSDTYSERPGRGIVLNIPTSGMLHSEDEAN